MVEMQITKRDGHRRNTCFVEAGPSSTSVVASHIPFKHGPALGILHATRLNMGIL